MKKEKEEKKIPRGRESMIKTLTKCLIQFTLIQNFKAKPETQIRSKDIIPEFYLNGNYDKSQTKLLEHDFFKKNLEKVIAQKIEIRSRRIIKHKQSKRVLLSERGQSQLFTQKILKQEKILKSIEIPLQRPFDTSLKKKFTRADLFWPHFNSKKNSFKNLGLTILNREDSQTYQGRLISSMVYFENTKYKDIDQERKLFFKAEILTPTASKQYLRNVLDSKITVRQKDPNHNSEDQQYITCDSAEYVNNAKVYVLCWRFLAEDEKSDYDITDRGLLKLFLRVYDPLTTSHKNVFQLKDTVILSVSLDKIKEDDLKVLKTHLSFNGIENSTNLVIWDQTGNFFVVYQMKNDRFGQIIYPHDDHSREGVDQFWLRKPKKSLTSPEENVVVKKVFTLKKDCYIIQSSEKIDDKETDVVYYINSQKQKTAKFVDEGVYMNNENRDKGYSKLFRQIFVFQVEDSEKGKYIGKLKTLIFDSDSFYYNGNSMQIEAEGDPRLHQFWSSESYYIHASTIARGGDVFKNDIRSVKKHATLYICSKEDPDIYVQVTKLNDYVAIDVSPQNDFIYVRSKFTTDVMRLQQILINVNITDLVLLTGSKLNSDKKLVKNLKQKNKEFEPTEYFKFYFVAKMENNKKYTPDQFDASKPEFKDLVIESFMVMHFPYKDLFKVKSLNSQIGLIIDQTSSIPIKFNYLNFGNFILFKSLSNLTKKNESQKSDNDATIQPFLDYTPSFKEKKKNNEKGKDESKEEVFVQSIFAVNNMQKTYYFINLGGDPSNLVWLYNSDTGNFTEFLKIRDHRKLDSVQFLDNKNYLLNVGELIYHLDVQKKRYKPIYKSDDLCGKVSTVVHHSTLGKLTVCGGNKRLSIFDTDFQNDKIDFSIPNKNVHIDEIINNEFKTLNIGSLVSSKSHPNHFGLVSEIIVDSVSQQSKNQGGGTTISNQKLIDIKKTVKIRFYEICVGKEKIEIFLEESKIFKLPATTHKVMPYLIGNYFVLLLSHKPEKNSENFDNFIYEEIRTYKITNAFDLLEEKIYLQDNNIKLNFLKNKPIVTFLEESSNTKARKVQKIAFLSEVTINIKNEIPDLYFQDQTKKTNVITFFDPSLPALSCMNIIKPPDNFEPLKIGPMMLNGYGEFKGIGLLIYGKRYNTHKIFHMVNHHFEIDFHFYRNLNSVFGTNTTKNKIFEYELINLQSSDETATKKAKIEFEIMNRAPNNITLGEDLADGKKIEFDLTKGHKIIKLTDKKDNLKIKGPIYGIDFTYESPLEKIADRLKAKYMKKRMPILDESIYKAKMAMWEELKFSYEYGTFETSEYDIMYPVHSNDYIRLLSMDLNMVMAKDKAKGTWNYINLFKGMRKVSSGKVVMEYDTSEQAKGEVKILKYAEIGVGVTHDPDEPRELEVFIFDNYTRYDEDLEKKETKKKDKTFDFSKETVTSHSLTKKKIKEKKQVIKIKYENDIDMNRLSIQCTLNAVVISHFAKAKDIVVEYDVILLRGVMRKEKKDLHKAFVVPISLEKRKMKERVWWYDINVMTNLMYTNKNSVNKLMERICIVGVFRTNKLNLYFRCVSDYARYGDMNLKDDEYFNSTNFRAIVEDSLGDLKKSKEPLVKGIDQFYNLGKTLKVIGNKTNEYEKNHASTDLYFMIKVPDRMNYLIKLNPNLNEDVKRVKIYMREIYNPFSGFREEVLFPDISMGNVYIRPIIFKKKSFIAYYFLSSSLKSSNKVSYTLQVINCQVDGYKKEGLEDAKEIKKDPVEFDKELKDTIISPVQIFNFTGKIVDLTSFELFSKNVSIKESYFERLFNFSKYVETGRTTVCRAFEEKCRTIPLNSYDILVKVNETLTYSRIYKVNFMPQIEISGKSQYLVSDWVKAKFLGFFNRTEERKIEIKSMNLVNPLFLIPYLAPLLILIAFLVCLVFVLRYLFAIYTLKMTEEINKASPFSKLLMKYAGKKEKDKDLVIGLKTVREGNNSEEEEEFDSKINYF